MMSLTLGAAVLSACSGLAIEDDHTSLRFGVRLQSRIEVHDAHNVDGSHRDPWHPPRAG